MAVRPGLSPDVLGGSIIVEDGWWKLTEMPF
jgi:hypothetical protein